VTSWALSQVIWSPETTQSHVQLSKLILVVESEPVQDPGHRSS
jgi:hypothetical protein